MPKSCAIVKGINACWYESSRRAPRKAGEADLPSFEVGHELRRRLVCPRPLAHRKMTDAQKELCKP
jgi:hypothetical protein